MSLAWPAMVQLVVFFHWLAVFVGFAKSTLLCFIIVINFVRMHRLSHRLSHYASRTKDLCTFVFRITTGPSMMICRQ